MTKSASSRSAVTSALRKSPSPSRYSHWRSSMLITPSPLMSFGSRVNFLPLAWVLVSSNCGSFSLEQRRLVVELRRVAVRGVRRRDQLLEAEVHEVQREELGEVAPLGVVAREQDRPCRGRRPGRTPGRRSSRARCRPTGCRTRRTSPPWPTAGSCSWSARGWCCPPLLSCSHLPIRRLGSRPGTGARQMVTLSMGGETGWKTRQERVCVNFVGGLRSWLVMAIF